MFRSCETVNRSARQGYPNTSPPCSSDRTAGIAGRVSHGDQQTTAPHIIGVDLDNTLISYDELIYRCAVDAGLIPATTRRHKKTIRDHIRQLPDGERSWIQLQVYIYGEGLAGAQPFEGRWNF